jgi:transcriptional regulator with XRE-family HTH domain
MRRRDIGARDADRLVYRLAEELRIARLDAGLGLRDVARASGISKSQLHRYEHARVPHVSVRDLAVLSAVLGMRLGVRPYPAGPPLRDAAHARLLARFKSRLHPAVRMRTEVRLRTVADDLRAWDAELALEGDTCKVEAETVLYDLQAMDRRLARKMGDDGVERVVLLVADTRRNRGVMREFRELIAERYPLGTREIMRALGGPRLPPRSGVVIL